MALSSGGFRSFDSIARAAATPSVTRSPMAANPNRTVSAAPRGPIASSPLRNSVSARALSVGGGGAGSARVAGPASLGKVRGPIAGPIGGGMRSAALAIQAAPIAYAGLTDGGKRSLKSVMDARAAYNPNLRVGPAIPRQFGNPALRSYFDGIPNVDKMASVALSETPKKSGALNVISSMKNRLDRLGSDYSVDDLLQTPAQYTPAFDARGPQRAYSARQHPDFYGVSFAAAQQLYGGAKPLHTADSYYAPRSMNPPGSKPHWATPDKRVAVDDPDHRFYDLGGAFRRPDKASLRGPVDQIPDLPDPNPYRVAGMDAAKADLAKRPAAASAPYQPPKFGAGRISGATLRDQNKRSLYRHTDSRMYGDVSGVDPDTVAIAQKALKDANLAVDVNSGFRSHAGNKRAGGVRNSAHLRGNALDLGTSRANGFSDDDIRSLRQALSKAGAGGIGYYSSGTTHVDDEGVRGWGDDYTRKSIPRDYRGDYARHMAGDFSKGIGLGKMGLGAKPAADIPLPDRNTRDLSQDDVSLAGSAPVRGPIAGLGRRLPAVAAAGRAGGAGGAVGGVASVGGAGSDLPPQNVPLPSRNPRITAADVALGGGGTPVRGPMAGVPRRITGGGGVGTSALPGGRASASANGIGLPDWQQALIAGDAPDLTPVSGDGSVDAGNGRVGGARGPIAGVRPHIAGSLGRYGGGIPGGAGVSGSAALPPQIAAVAGAPSGGVAAGASVAGPGAVWPRGPIASRYGAPRNPNDGLGGLNPAAAPASADLEPSILDQWKQAALDKLTGAGDYVKDAATKAIVTDQVSKVAGAAGDYIGQGVDYVGGKIAGAVGSVNDAAQSGMQQVADVAPMLQVYADSGKLWQQVLAQQDARNRPDQLAPVAGDAPPASVPGGSEGGNVGQPNQPSQSLAQQYDAILREIAKDQTNPVLQAKFKQIEAALIEELKRKQAMNQRGAAG